MATSKDTPKIFISYSWKPISNKQKTLELAERMVNEGIIVVLDEWDLTEGQDKYQFMEQMVNDPEIKRVLIICNNDYQEKANHKKGGVGVESLIISDNIYKQADQKKFVPIIFERDSNGNSFAPTFIHSRIYIDLSSEEVFEEEYEKLLRNIFDRPSSKRPPLGTPPAYLFEDNPIFLRTAHKVKTIKNALIGEKKNYQVFINDYYDHFVQALSDFEISQDELKEVDHLDEIVLKKIEELKVLRDDFIDFLETTLTYSVDFEVEKFNSFLEKILIHSQSTNSLKQSSRVTIDQYKFFNNELFLYIAAIMISKEKYSELGNILNNDLIIYNERTRKTEAVTFMNFNKYVESLEGYRKNRLNSNRISLTADLIKQRADSNNYDFKLIKETDALLYYIGIMRRDISDSLGWNRWFPRTSVYSINSIGILDKLISTRHFEKIKPLFDVLNIEQLKVKIDNVINSKADKLHRYDYEVPLIQFSFDFEKIGEFK